MARSTAKAAAYVYHTDIVPRRQTRAFAASLQAFAHSEDGDLKRVIKHEQPSDDDSSPSSAVSQSVFDIEDAHFTTLSSKKRKRGFGIPSTVVTSVSTVTSTRTSPRKSQGSQEGPATTAKINKARRQPAKRITNEAGKEEVQPPTNWEEIYDVVKKMRKEKLAPVDTMGCETLAEEHLIPRDKRFQTLIALMLSSQTKDTTNAIAMRRLQTELPHPGLTLENILDVDPDKLNEMIFVVGFHNNKTRYIKAAALILRDQFGGDIPETIEGLMSLPGVGPKMAYLCMSAAWGRTEGIGVDVHVHRITNLWGWHKTKGPEDTRAALEAWLPKEKWHEINHLLVGFGQITCLPVGRRCEDCRLSGKGLCPSAVVNKKVIKRVKKEVKMDEDEDVKLENTVEVAVRKEELIADDG